MTYFENIQNNLKSHLRILEKISEREDLPKKKKLEAKQQLDPLRIELDKRKGKLATLITEFQGTDEELKALAKLLKVKCSTGGSSRDGEILLQGDFREKIAELLLELGYKVKRINFTQRPTAPTSQSGRQKS